MSYPRRKSPRLKEFDYAVPNHVFFLTICVKAKQCVFTNDVLNRAVITIIKEEKKRLGHEVYAYVLMPDHLHLLASPLETGKSITQLVGAISSRTIRLLWQHGYSGKLFQRSFYDHIIRKDEDLRKIAKYILNNSVRKELAQNWEDYPYGGFLDPFPL